MKILAIVTLAALAACTPNDLKSAQGLENGSQINPCGLPAGVNVDTRLIEPMIYDKTKCQPSNDPNNCAYVEINTHEQLVQLNTSLTIEQSDVASSTYKIEVDNTSGELTAPSEHMDAKIIKATLSECYVDGAGPYNCGTQYFVSFQSNEDAQKFIATCIAK